MSWTPNEKEILTVVSLEAAKRYEQWIKKVVDEEIVWSLWKEGGWALAEDNARRQLVPVWPHSKYAALGAEGFWAGYKPKSITLDEWVDSWIPGIERDERFVAVFPTPGNKGVAVEPRGLERDLREELLKYE
jgi:hypothetical protein